MFDCFEHAWYKIPPMKMARAFASANVIDGKIYVFGGCGDDVDSSNWAEVYNPRTYTWDFLCVPTTTRPKNIKQSAVIGKKKVYVVDEDRQIFSFSPSKLPPMFVSCGKTDSKPGDRDDWCLIGGFLFSRGARGTILWCLPEEFDWKEVKGLEELQQQQLVEYDITKLSTNYASNIVIFWNAGATESLELWSAEISLTQIEASQGLEIRGKIEWSGSVYKLDYPLSESNRVKVLFAAKENSLGVIVPEFDSNFTYLPPFNGQAMMPVDERPMLYGPNPNQELQFGSGNQHDHLMIAFARVLERAHASFVGKVPYKSMAAFTMLQIFYFGLCYGVTWIPVAGIMFPVPFFLLIAIRQYLFPNLLKPAHLRELDVSTRRFLELLKTLSSYLSG
ncbi:hypothetical protein Bca101_049431 [Brassica carinata]